MGKAHFVVLSGVFYRDEKSNDLLVADEVQGTTSVRDVLESMQGAIVTFVAHHCPPDPPDSNRWGGGCCLEQPSGQCHAGHHERPSWLYQETRNGALSCKEGEWFVDEEKLHLNLLAGHHGQIVVTSLPDIEEIKADIEDDLENPTLERLQGRIEQLRGFLEMINQEKDKL